MWEVTIEHNYRYERRNFTTEEKAKEYFLQTWFKFEKNRKELGFEKLESFTEKDYAVMEYKTNRLSSKGNIREQVLKYEMRIISPESRVDGCWPIEEEEEVGCEVISYEDILKIHGAHPNNVLRVLITEKDTGAKRELKPGESIKADLEYVDNLEVDIKKKQILG